MSFVHAKKCIPQKVSAWKCACAHTDETIPNEQCYKWKRDGNVGWAHAWSPCIVGKDITNFSVL